MVEIYTDGSCIPNPGVGGWGALLRYGRHERELCGGEPHSTNNRMELTAPIMALQTLKRTNIDVVIFTDSQYVKNGLTIWLPKWKQNGWTVSNGDPVKNQDLWEILDRYARRYRITWEWVRGHAGNVGNERADALAEKGRIDMRPSLMALAQPNIATLALPGLEEA